MSPAQGQAHPTREDCLRWAEAVPQAQLHLLGEVSLVCLAAIPVKERQHPQQRHEEPPLPTMSERARVCPGQRVAGPTCAAALCPMSRNLCQVWQTPCAAPGRSPHPPWGCSRATRLTSVP